MSLRKQLSDAPPAGKTPGTRPARLSGGLDALRQACRQIAGIPDYERYLAHMAEHHPGEPVLSHKEYFAQAIDRKYGRGGPRCC